MVESELRLLSMLGNGPKTARELREPLGISQPTFSRLIAGLEKGGQVRAFGAGRSTQYVRLRSTRNLVSIPFHRIDRNGHYETFGTLWCISGGYAFESADRPSRPDYFLGHLPWFVQDMQPQGFLGRAFPNLFPDLGLPARIQDWSDDDSLYAVATRGEDAPGNLIAGEESFRRFLKARTSAPPQIQSRQRVDEYARLADATMSGTPAGSSAGGEQPKFAVQLSPPDARHVIVKFSPSFDTLSGRRWADLLVGEHLALSVLRNAGIHAAQTELIVGERRNFLEIARFDRIGNGRAGVASFAAVDDHFFGHRDDWIRAGERMAENDWLDPDDLRTLRIAFDFGQLIGNSDMHFGNVSILTDGKRPYRLAPFYDCLPMLYAPVAEQIVPRNFEISFPQSAERMEEWKIAFALASDFWQEASVDSRISQEFQTICAANLASFQRIHLNDL